MADFSSLNGYYVKDQTARDNINKYKEITLKQIDTIARLKQTTDLNNGDIVLTKGYSAINDGGNAKYYIKTKETEIDNGGTVHELQNNLVAILLDNVINAKVLNIENLNDLNNYDLSNIDKIILNDNINLTGELTLNNIEIDCKNYTITIDGEDHNNIILQNNCIFKNAKFVYEDNSALTITNGKIIKITGNNNLINNCEFNGYYSIYANSSIDNLEVSNCLLNSFRSEICLEIGRFTNIKIHDNKQTREQNYSTPAQHHNIIQIYNKLTWNNNSLVSGELTQDLISNYYGNNIYIYNNEFNTINTRSINIVNCHNVLIKNNKTYNPFGDKTNHTLVGYSDDVYVVDLCKYCEISNNIVENSGENAIDVLSCKNVTVQNNILTGIDSDGVCISVSDMIAEGVLAVDVTDATKVSEFISVVGNIIETVKVGVRVGSRNSNINGNTLILNSNHTDTVGISFVSYTALNNIGNYGNIDATGNNIDKNMSLGFTSGGNTIFTNINSNIMLDENSGLKATVNIDNSSLANDTDTKLYVYTHNVYFKHFKMYLINSNDNNRLIELPLNYYNNKGIVDYDNGKYNFYFTTFKKFANIPTDSQSSAYKDLTQGSIKLILY